MSQLRAIAAAAGVVNMSLANVAEEAKLAKLLNPESRDAQGNRLAPDLSHPSPETARAGGEGRP